MASEDFGKTLAQAGKSAKATLMGVDAARATMLDAITPLGEETAPLRQARGRTLARAVTASRDQPPFAVSAMDGYALRAADTPGALQVVGESAAGRGFDGRVQAGQAVRISTGAAIPEGVDAVAIQEDVTREGGAILAPPCRAGANIRPRAGDFACDAVLIEAGRRLDGIALALAAGAGGANLVVKVRPRIAILCSGDELVAPGEVPGPFQVFESGTYGVAGLIERWGGVAERLDIARDDAPAIAGAAELGLRNHDLLVVIGGASVGDHDLAKPALRKLGLNMLVDKVALRPGKPTWFGTTPLGPVLGLPGNPASALVCAQLFLKPLIERMVGRDGAPVFQTARLGGALPANGPREHYLRAHLGSDDEGRLHARAFEMQDSSLVSVFAAANALIRIPADTQALEAGALVKVLPLDQE